MRTRNNITFAQQGWNLRNAPCQGCPHPLSYKVQHKGVCARMCQSYAAVCTGWVWNTLGKCYIKGGILKWTKATWTGGITWAGPSDPNLWHKEQLRKLKVKLLPVFATRQSVRESSAWDRYFKALYGEIPPEGAFPLRTAELALVHTDLPTLALHGLHHLTYMAPACPRHVGDPYTEMSRTHDTPGTVSLLRKGPFRAVPDHSIVEVTHCSNKKWEGLSSEAFGSWLYVAPGSGISFAVGTTFVVNTHKELERHVPGRLCTNSFQCWQLYEPAFAAARRAGYDSVQILNHKDARCSFTNGQDHSTTRSRDFNGQSFAHEIVDLHGDGRHSCGSANASATRYRAGWRGSKACVCDNALPCSNCALIKKRSWHRPSGMRGRRRRDEQRRLLS